MTRFIEIYYPYPTPDYQINIIKDLLRDMLGYNCGITTSEGTLFVAYHNEDDYDFEDFANSLKADLMIELTVFDFGTTENYEAYAPVLQLFKEHSFFFKNAYWNEKKLLTVHHKIFPEYVKRAVLKKYYDDYSMLELVKVFIELNGNTSKTAKQMFLHRNTIINKIDKFIKVTGYDIRNFQDAYIIYNILA